MQPPSPCCACLEGREERRVDGWSGMGKSGPETSRLTSPAAARCVRVGLSAVAARSCGDETLVRPASPPPPRAAPRRRPRPRRPVRGRPARHERTRTRMAVAACGGYAVVRAAVAWIVTRPRAGTMVAAYDRISRAGPPPAEARGGDRPVDPPAAARGGPALPLHACLGAGL